MRTSYEEFFDIREDIGCENVIWDIVSGIFKSEPIAATIAVIGFTIAAGLKASDWYNKYKFNKAKKKHDERVNNDMNDLIRYANYMQRDEVIKYMNKCEEIGPRIADKVLKDAEKYFTLLPFLYKLNNSKIKLDPTVLTKKNDMLNDYDDLETGKNKRGFGWFDVIIAWDTSYDISNIEISLVKLKDGSYGVIMKGSGKTATFTSKEIYATKLGFFGETIDNVLKDLKKSTDYEDADALVQWLEGKVYDWAYEDFETLQRLFAEELYKNLGILKDKNMAHNIISSIPNYSLNYVPVLYKVKK